MIMKVLILNLIIITQLTTHLVDKQLVRQRVAPLVFQRRVTALLQALSGVGLLASRQPLAEGEHNQVVRPLEKVVSALVALRIVFRAALFVPEHALA